MKKSKTVWRSLVAVICAVMLPAISTAGAFAVADEQAAAEQLHELKLLQSVGTDANGNPNFALDRSLTRAEAVVAVVRLLGKEAEALAADTSDLPFADVPEWAAPHIAWAYKNGVTKGIGANTFGTDVNVTATQYLSFALRALGYKDGVDFQWNSAWTLSDKLGITHGEYSAENNGFRRGDLAAVSRAALNAKTADGTATLIQKLVSAGAVAADTVIKLGVATEEEVAAAVTDDSVASDGTKAADTVVASGAANVQEITTNFSELWTSSNISVKVGVPVKWYVYVPAGALDHLEMGCENTIKIPGLGRGTDSYNKNERHFTLVEGKNFVCEFTPTKVEDILFTWWMGSRPQRRQHGRQHGRRTQ